MDRNLSGGIYRIRPKRGNQVAPIVAFQAFDPDADEIDVLDALVRMHRVSSRHGMWKGEFLRRQIENFPARARRRGDVRPLQLEDGEGLGHGAAFQFDPSNNILVWQHVRAGASLSRFAGYLGELASTSYVIEPVVTVDAMAALNQARAKRIHVRIAAPDDLRAVDAKQRSLRSAFRLFGDVADGAYVEVTVGSERGSDSFLPVRKMREFLGWLLQESNADRGGIQRLKIDGVTPDANEVRVIDLLQGRMRDSIRIDIDGDNLDRNFQRRLNWLGTVYDKFREDIDELYPPQ